MRSARRLPFNASAVPSWLAQASFAAIGVGLLAGCGAAPPGQSPAAISALLAGDEVALNAAQAKVVEDGVRSMIGNPSAASFEGVAARKLDGKQGVHVCGYVTAAGLSVQTRFYVELRNEAGVPVAQRGQVGTDDAKLAKVRFVCRKHDGA